jgi:DNA-binding CsgD family transcriptional regulator
MDETSSQYVDAVTKMTQIATQRGLIVDRANALLEPLGEILPFQAVWLSRFDTVTDRYESVVTEGHSPRTETFLQSRETVATIDMLQLTQLRHAVSARDVPGGPLPEREIWAELLLPSGFKECITVGLFDSFGRHIGMLILNTDDENHPTPAESRVISDLAPLIGRAIDATQTVAGAAAMVSTATAGVVLDRAGNLLPLPGLPGHPLLAPASAALTMAISRLDPQTRYARFLYPNVGAKGYVQITIFTVEPQPFAELTAVALLSPAPDLHGLTHRELQVLGLLVDGWSNQRIAATLWIRVRTVNAHVEHILTKLAAATRTAAAVCAVREGIYVPNTHLACDRLRGSTSTSTYEELIRVGIGSERPTA